MPTAASNMISSQLPLAPEPLITTGRYTVRSILANRASCAHLPEYVCLISSPARDQFVPAQPDCSGALLLVWFLSTADQASISSIALAAYLASRVRYHSSAWV